MNRHFYLFMYMLICTLLLLLLLLYQMIFFLCMETLSRNLENASTYFILGLATSRRPCVFCTTKWLI